MGLWLGISETDEACRYVGLQSGMSLSDSACQSPMGFGSGMLSPTGFRSGMSVTNGSPIIIIFCWTPTLATIYHCQRICRFYDLLILSFHAIIFVLASVVGYPCCGLPLLYQSVSVDSFNITSESDKDIFKLNFFLALQCTVFHNLLSISELIEAIFIYRASTISYLKYVCF